MTFFDTPGILATQVAEARSRLLSAGVNPAQYDAVTAGLATLRDWPAAFTATAHEHVARAERSVRRAVTAGEAYRDAALWFHFATTLPASMPTTHALAEESLHSWLRYTEPEARILRTEFCTGVLRRPYGIEVPPVVVLVPGMDSSKVEFQYIADTLVQRGLACLAIDGPGQGVRTSTTAPDANYHTVISDAVDQLPDTVDTSRVGVLGMSLGGFYAARALADDARIATGVAVSAPFRLSFDGLPPFVTDTLTLRCGSQDAARRFAQRIDLSDVVRKIQQPLRVIDGCSDVIPGVTGTRQLAELAERAEHLLVPGANHLLANATWKWLPETADWLYDQLTAEVNSGERSSSIMRFASSSTARSSAARSVGSVTSQSSK